MTPEKHKVCIELADLLIDFVEALSKELNGETVPVELVIGMKSLEVSLTRVVVGISHTRVKADVTHN